jgi:hypothetical protein
MICSDSTVPMFCCGLVVKVSDKEPIVDAVSAYLRSLSLAEQVLVSFVSN